MNWIRLRFGLKWKRPAWVELLDRATKVTLWLVLAFCAYHAWQSWSTVSARLAQAVHRSEVAQATALHYEQIVVSCLNHGIVAVNGKPTICEL